MKADREIGVLILEDAPADVELILREIRAAGMRNAPYLIRGPF